MRSPSAWLTVVYAVHEALTVALDTSVTIGPPLTQDYLRDGVIIAGDTTSEDGQAGEFWQETHATGGLCGSAAERDDAGSIACEVWAQSGDDPLPPLFDRAFAILGAALDVLRDDVGLGLSDVLNLGFEAGTVFAGPSEQGAFVRLPFTISYAAII